MNSLIRNTLVTFGANLLLASPALASCIGSAPINCTNIPAPQLTDYVLVGQAATGTTGRSTIGSITSLLPAAPTVPTASLLGGSGGNYVPLGIGANLGFSGSNLTVVTGTTGAVIPLLNGTNTWANPQTFSSAITVPTATPGTNTTQAASTAFVQAAVVAAGGGNVTGPGSSTNGYLPTWSGTSGTSLAAGLPVGLTGNSTVVETTSGGLLTASILPKATSSAFGAVECDNTTITCASGVISTVLSPSLTSTYIYVGNSFNAATAVALSGDGTLSNTGGLTISHLTHVTDASLANSGLAHSSMIFGGQTLSLGGTAVAQGNGGLIQLSTGTPVAGHCAQFDANLNIVDAGGVCTTGGGGGTVSSGLINQLAWYAGAGTTVSGLTTHASSVLVTDSGGVPSISATLPSAVQGNITGLGTVATGTWNGGVVAGAYGGTGVANTGFTITLGGNLATSGAYNATFTLAGLTNVALPTSGTLLTTTGSGASLTGTAASLTAGHVTTNANLTGPITSSGNATSVASQTGTGSTFVMSASPTITGSFTATGLVTNADLANAATTVNGQTCTLGSTCTITASAGTITVGGTSIATGTTNGLLYDNSGILGNLATANSGVLVTSGGGAPSISTTLPTGLAMQTPASITLTNGTGTAPGLTAGAVSTISGMIAAGANVTITGSGTSGSPYSIAAVGSSGAPTINCVTVYGMATGNSAATNTTDLNACIVAAGTAGASGGPTIAYIPAGTYAITTCTINTQNVTLMGAGGKSGATNLQTNQATGDVCNIGDPNQTDPITANIVGIEFSSSVTRTAGTMLHRWGAQQSYMSDVFVNGPGYNGIVLEGGSNAGSGACHTNCSYQNSILYSKVNLQSNAGIIVGNPSSTWTAGFPQNEYLTDVETSINGTGLNVNNCGGCYLTRVQGVQNQYGLTMLPGSGQLIEAWISTSQYDSGVQAGVTLRTAGTGVINLYADRLIATYTGSDLSSHCGPDGSTLCTNANGIGLNIGGSGVTQNINASFTNLNMLQNAAQGILFASPTNNVSFTGAMVQANSYASLNAHSQVEFAAAATGSTQITFVGGQYGSGPIGPPGYTGNNAKYAIDFGSGTMNYIIVSGVSLSGNNSSGSCTIGGVSTTGGLQCATLNNSSTGNTY